MFTSLINYEKVNLQSTSRKRKYSFNLGLQDVVPTWHLNGKRKAIKTDAERLELARDTGFTIIGDPVLELSESTKHFLCECNVCKFKIVAQKSYLAKKELNCINCLNNRHALEASQHGLELIGASVMGDPKRRHYRFVGCNHTRDISTGDVRSGQFSCTECYQSEFERKMDECGFENLGKHYGSSTAQHYNVKYKSCGHTRLAIQSHIMTNTVGGCPICYEERLALTVLEKYDVTLLERLSDTFRIIKFNGCGHTKQVRLSNLKGGHIMCQICQLEKFKREADEAGLTYAGAVSTVTAPTKKHKYVADCGHSLFLKPNAVRMGHWACRTCDSGYLDRPNKLYLFEITCGDFSFIKMGYSQKPEYRKYDYKLLEGSIESLIKVVTVKTGREAILLENALHVKYKQFNYKSSEMRQYLTESGFSECYPLSLKEELVAELDEIERGL